jgi:hypothetical protein
MCWCESVQRAQASKGAACANRKVQRAARVPRAVDWSCVYTSTDALAAWPAYWFDGARRSHSLTVRVSIHLVLLPQLLALGHLLDFVA